MACEAFPCSPPSHRHLCLNFVHANESSHAPNTVAIMHLESSHSRSPAPQPRSSALATRFSAVRQQTEALIKPLSPEDCQLQSMPDASPAKWHLAHLTWFFETFILERFEPGF